MLPKTSASVQAKDAKDGKDGKDGGRYQPNTHALFRIQGNCKRVRWAETIVNPTNQPCSLLLIATVN